MKKYGALIALGVAIIFGVLAVFLANRLITTQVPTEIGTTEAKEQLSVTAIVIAAADIPIGTPLSSAVLTKAQWPKANVPKGAFHEIKELEGRVAVSKLSAGTPLLKAELAEPGSGAGLVALIPRGTRAMSIRVDEVIGVAGFILPGTFVDVVHVDTKKSKDVSTIILEKIQVLAIAQEAYAEEEGGKARIVRTVTLLLKPEEATLLALKTREGSIHLLLRSPLEEKKAEVVPQPEPKGEKKVKPIPVLKSRVRSPRPKPHTIEIIRGTTRKEVTFKDVESEDIVQ
ncbi:MAG: Flp pilus assembly protein CpaB [Desulfobulbaceae bacterium]|jgi:pilus assembly protein CpaB|nr:Flp pilus assembly protein CpaB [Desulfobulbaceae bacterium]